MKNLTGSLLFLSFLLIISSCGNETTASETQLAEANDAAEQVAEEERLAAEKAAWRLAVVKKRLARDERRAAEEDRIASLREEPKDGLGLDEQTRKEVFYELIVAERSASAASKRKYPSGADWEKAYDLEEKLLATRRSKLAKTYGYDEDDWFKIAGEGLRKGWPEPPR